MEELSTDRTYDSLTTYIEELDRIKKEENDLIVEFVTNKKLLQILEHKLVRCRTEHNNNIKRLDTRIYDLDNQIHVNSTRNH